LQVLHCLMNCMSFISDCLDQSWRLFLIY
jgi:hypothetical protein